MTQPLRVLMFPQKNSMDGDESGVRRVVDAYYKYLGDYGIKLVNIADEYDLIASHAAAYPTPEVLICHGLYWTGDYPAEKYEFGTNSVLASAIRQAKQITVPSEWVAETFRRDMRLNPHVVPHGIDWQEWQHDYEPEGYVLWNKNRVRDVCNPEDALRLAILASQVPFVSTFADADVPPNMKVTGPMAHGKMKPVVQKASVYLSTIKETFGIGILEALASGTPVLGWRFGGNMELVQHGVNGFLAEPGDYEGLLNGLEYILAHRQTLSRNAIELAKGWTWQVAAEKMANVLRLAAVHEKPTVGVVIPSYNYGTPDKLGRAIQSVLDQTYAADQIVVVDDGSDDAGATEALVKKFPRVTYIRQDNAGVANARNNGIAHTTTKYVCCLDADDAIQPTYLDVCVRALEADRSFAIAYTGLTYIKPDGEIGLSPWPGKYDFDEQLRGKNQIPTCCVFRRVMWERLGGYKQRYAPGGAGSEDAEFWLRAGAYGYAGRKVTDEGLFLYSWLSGRVSGNKNYHEVDWRELHPWTKDSRHPFLSAAAPRNISHPAHQYDQPLISVVIPVGPAHEGKVTNALDSLESQTFRDWEAILAWDGDKLSEKLDYLKTAYPYARIVQSDCKGAGHARNVGAANARAPLLLFLDADDWLYPMALRKMYDAYLLESSIIYCDYVGKAYITAEESAKMQRAGRLLYYNDQSTEAVIAFRSADYDCPRAQRQPEQSNMYIWNLITSLVPREWHNEVDGFDEIMPSWEDWDYWIKLAKAGKCFHRIPEQLVVYQFSTGTRRESGLQHFQNLIEYLQEKYKGLINMPCGSCGGKNRGTTTRTAPAQQRVERAQTVADEDYVLVSYAHPNIGQHKVVGAATKTFYGYRGGGNVERFYVHKDDMNAQPQYYLPVATDIKKPAAQKTTLPPAPKEIAPTPQPQPKPVEVAPASPTSMVNDPDVFDLQTIPGVTTGIAAQLNSMGYHTPEDLMGISDDQLFGLKGMGPARVSAIREYLTQYRRTGGKM